MNHTGLSGNEIFCLNKLGYTPGDLIIGNSVFSLGLVGGIISGFKGLVGGEIHQYTEMIAEGRRLSLERLQKELDQKGGVGATGVTSELVFHPGNIEFLSIGSALHSTKEGGTKFTSSSDGQELYCQIDSNYEPVKFVFGNVAYSIGLGQGILGALKSLGRGEVKEYTDIFQNTRNLALNRLVEEAKNDGANSVVGIKTSIVPFAGVGVQEMVMIGTASKTKYYPEGGTPATSDLTCEEMWNMTNMGYVPMKLMLGTSVYSLGIVGGISSWLKNLVKGEISELTSMIYDAREESIGKITSEAEAMGADDVVGIKTYIYSLGGGLIEFMAIGTAVKKVGPSVTTRTEHILPQAIIQDKDTFFNSAENSFGLDLNQGKK